MVAFTDLTINNPTSWIWDFGDGNTSTDRNPSHTYVTKGTYTVKLTAANGAGSNTIEKSGYIYVGKTITVAADGTGDYTSLTSAVAAATSGDTIFIKQGSYMESSVNSISISQSNLAIHGEGVDKVLISFSSFGVGINIIGSACSIEGLKFQPGSYLVRLTGSSNIIRNNTFGGSSNVPLTAASGSLNNVIENNVFVQSSGSTSGVYLASGANFNTVRNNLISGATGTYGARISSTSNIFENNTIRDGSNYGQYISNINNTITNNLFINLNSAI